jgi:hypothetical protein
MIDANFKSTIYLKNEVATDPITVTPILYLSNGHKYTLHDVRLEPAGVATININQALADQRDRLLGDARWICRNRLYVALECSLCIRRKRRCRAQPDFQFGTTGIAHRH